MDESEKEIDNSTSMFKSIPIINIAIIIMIPISIQLGNSIDGVFLLPIPILIFYLIKLSSKNYLKGHWLIDKIPFDSTKFGLLVYIVGIIVNAYWGLELDDFMGIGLSLIFSFLALRNIHNLKRLKLTIFFIFASILHWTLSVIIWFICCWSF